jgi:hypothetical protein
LIGPALRLQRLACACEFHHDPGKPMVITSAHITPLVAIIAGILILVMPRLLNYIVAIYLIFVGLVGLNSVHHFINWH